MDSLNSKMGALRITPAAAPVQLDTEGILSFAMKCLHISREEAEYLLEFSKLVFPEQWEIIDQPLNEKIHGKTLQLYIEMSQKCPIQDAAKGSDDATWNVALQLTCFVLKKRLECIRPPANVGMNRTPVLPGKDHAADNEEVILRMFERPDMQRPAAMAKLTRTRKQYPAEWEMIDQPDTEEFYGVTFEMYTKLSQCPRFRRVPPGALPDIRDDFLDLTRFALNRKLERIRASPR